MKAHKKASYGRTGAEEILDNKPAADGGGQRRGTRARAPRRPGRKKQGKSKAAPEAAVRVGTVVNKEFEGFGDWRGVVVFDHGKADPSSRWKVYYPDDDDSEDMSSAEVMEWVVAGEFEADVTDLGFDLAGYEATCADADRAIAVEVAKQASRKRRLRQHKSEPPAKIMPSPEEEKEWCRGLVGGEGHYVRELLGGCWTCDVRWCEFHERCATNGANEGAVCQCDCPDGPTLVDPRLAPDAVAVCV